MRLLTIWWGALSGLDDCWKCILLSGFCGLMAWIFIDGECILAYLEFYGLIMKFIFGDMRGLVFAEI